MQSKLLKGMVCCRKPTNKSNKPNFMSQRKAAVKSKAKTKMKCKGGALDGETLFLSTAGTMAFSLNGVKGYYNHLMEWVGL